MTAHAAVARAATGAPGREGLYDPAFEHDACGIGFVAHARGERSNAIVRQALELLDNLSHRSAVGCDPCTGDGAGILLQLPHAFLRQACAAAGVALPDAGAYAAGMLFLPAERAERETCEALAEATLRAEGLRLLGWRDVPVDPGQAGDLARQTLPAVRQLFVARDGMEARAFDRALYAACKRLERAVRESALAHRDAFAVVSLSAVTIVYKGMLRPDQLPRFYLDLADPAVESALALVHSRFSTNTFPSWRLAHPFRYLCHNGEINTLRGNLNWMRVRETRLASPLFGDVGRITPVIAPGQSDSQCLDNALELLVQGGRPLTHAMMMLIPEAWEGHAAMDVERRAFYEYHAALMEPWDGPAAVAFTDGVRIGATLDRNGLRPARYLVTDDDLVVLASEAGALPVAPERVRARGRLQPGRMFVVDTAQGRILEDEEVKAEVTAGRPYAAWLAEHGARPGAALPGVRHGEPADAPPLRQRQRAFGYTAEELKMILAPMAAGGEEPVGSMGNDTPLAVLSDEPQLLFKYFKQLFAQVTNPAIDPIREQLVMSLGVLLGRRGNLLEASPHHAAQLRLPQPVLTDAETAALRATADVRFAAATLPARFRAAGGPAALAAALDALCSAAEGAVRAGHALVVLSDRGVSAEWAPIPSLLATSAVHHHLIREGLRADASIVVETGEAREVPHVALLVGYGASAVNPYLAFETLTDMVAAGELAGTVESAHAKYVKAVGKGLLKVLSKMGISTLQSYCGAQIFEAVGLAPSLVDRHFTGTPSRIGGIDLTTVGEETLRRHAAAFAPEGAARLGAGGEYHYRARGEHHRWNPATIAALQHATRGGGYRTFKEFSRLANEASARRATLRGLLDFAAGDPVPLDEVEPASSVVRRFTTGAMSLGALSPEAHETLALAMNRIGGRSNTGEGGEDPARFDGERNSAIKQVASGRFGVTTEYLVNAVELQIKIAQGAKPGEGGQLPGAKVNELIARTRYSTPGVTLISPPPHHDIYSIEDLAQLIFDLKNVNPRAMISVKLVAEAGVGTIAAGVAKARADLIVISGDSGGTGASPLSSIKHAGIPWELGLAETQQTLVLNDLRGRVRLQTDGQLKTGRDVVLAALLGADEFGFSTAPLIVEGCVMMRKCHLNTCPVGVATQDPVLRAKFAGQPEQLVDYFFYVAEEVREIMASLGVRRVEELVGRTDLLRVRPASDHWKARALDLAPMLRVPSGSSELAGPARRHSRAQEHPIDAVLDHELIALARPALEERKRVRAATAVRNVNRAVGAMLSGEVARRFGHAGLPEGTIDVRLTGSAGQSFGAFCAAGVALSLEGEANDYFGKGLSGGRLAVCPPRGARLAVGDQILVGNTALYGATAGEAYVAGAAGERFAVRNSGARTVVEGVGDHGCEYMTGGAVVVLGRTGRNFAAGMSGGTAFVLDADGDFGDRCNRELVKLGPVIDRDHRRTLRRMVEMHRRHTGSPRAALLLDRWEEALARFVMVMPVEYEKVLELRRLRAAPARPAADPQQEQRIYG